ncbi:MATE family efflux transporter [uncultured Microscilla sp.]|uniref:MATE family efflux transporter n=1 Tax=uncultured Microscilla sp. TaxID=432653 RepID=UPI00260B99D5|nr:MATE family efflux transporter [uncultured Microscilla sp.]
MNKKILNLAIPNIISNVSVPLLSMVDLMLMGHLESEAYIGAVALGGMIFNFIFWGLGFLRMGTTGFTAQSLGNRRLDESVMTLVRALAVAMLAALIILLLQAPLAHVSFMLIQGSTEVEHIARSYFYIRIYAAPAALGLYALNGWFLGMQNAKAPLFISVLVNVANIGLNYLLVVRWGMKAEGVALGTVMAQYMGFLAAIGIFAWRYRKLFKYIVLKKAFQKADLWVFFKVNNDIFIRTLALISTFSFFYAESAKYGDQMLAVNSLLMQFLSLMAYGVDGFAFAAESLVGKAIGAKDGTLLHKSIRYIFRWGIGLAGLFSFTYWLAGEAVLGIMTDKTQVIVLASEFMPWVVLAPLVNAFCFIWDGIYIGATASKAMRNTTIIATFAVFLPAYFSTQHWWQNHGLWFAFTLFMATRGIGLAWLAKRYIRIY